MERKTHGTLSIIAGIFCPIFIPFGQGIVTGTNGLYWCGVFGIAYFVGLVCPGILVFMAAVKQSACVIPKQPTKLQPAWVGAFCFGIGAYFVLVLIGSQAFFRSDFFASSAGQHSFVIVEAVFLAQLIPFGLGTILADEQLH